MKTRTRSSRFTSSSVGPWRLTSWGVFVLVSERWIFVRSSGAFVSSGRATAGASLTATPTLAARGARLVVAALQPLGDLLHPAELVQARAAHDEAAGEGQPRLERAAEEAEPRRTRGVDLRSLPSRLRGLGEDPSVAGLELDRPRPVGEAEQRAAGAHVAELVEDALRVARAVEDPQDEIEDRLGNGLAARREVPRLIERREERDGCHGLFEFMPTEDRSERRAASRRHGGAARRTRRRRSSPRCPCRAAAEARAAACRSAVRSRRAAARSRRRRRPRAPREHRARRPDRKSTRLNSSHGSISYAVFCWKKKKTKITYVSLIKNNKKI